MRKCLMRLASFMLTIVFVGFASATTAQAADAQEPAAAMKTVVSLSDGKPVSNASSQAVLVAADIPAGTVVPIDNFEDGNYWAAVGDTWDKWGSHNLSLEAELSDKWGTYGPNCGDWVFDKIPAKGGQATFFTDQLILTDWTGVKYVVIDVNNPQAESFTMSFCCQTTDGWIWTQTPGSEVKPGVNTIVYDLTKGLTDGSNAAVPKLPGADQMKRAMFTVLTYGANGGSGRFYVDNIRVIK
jgi:hypothetical protein